MAFDAASQQLFFVNADANQVVALDISDPTAPTEAFSIDMDAFGDGVNSVAVYNGLVAVAAQADPAQDPGSVVFFDADGSLLCQVTVGALPDAVAFTPDGSKVLVANEGEPNDDYTVDPEGSVSIIDLSAGVGAATVTTIGFSDFNAGEARALELPQGVRIFGPGASVAQDLEPEFIATSPDGSKAYVTLQENNAIAVVDAVDEVLRPTLSNVFGQTDVFLNGTRADVRTQETNLGDLSADANLAAAQSFDPDVAVSIKNGGGIRADIGSFDYDTGAPIPPLGGQFKNDGEISQLEIANALLFNNGLSVLTATAAELLALIEHGVAATEPGNTPGQFPQVGGMVFSFDPSREPNDRVRTLSIVDAGGNAVDVIAQNGAVVGDPNRTIRVVTLDFLAGGGDGYPFPATGLVHLGDVLSEPGVATFAAPGSEQDALAEYLATTFTETPFALADTPPEADERIQNLAARSDGVPSGALGKRAPGDTPAASELPTSFELRGNYPNPFNPTTTIIFDVPEEASVHVDVYDMLGRHVLTVPQTSFTAGANRRIQVDGSTLPSGVYLYRLTAQTSAETHVRKGQMILLK